MRTSLRPHMKINGSIVALLLLLVLSMGTGPLALAQQDTGYILGTVTDQSGAALPGANVTIIWQSTGVSHALVTNEAGFYTSQPLQVGLYTVLVAKDGFAQAKVSNLVVDAATHVRADVTLHVGSASANVTVVAAPPLIDTTDPQISNTIDNRSAQQLPINGRSVLALALLTPGVVSAQGAVSEGFANRGTYVSEIRIAGGVNGMNENILDGVSNMQNWVGEVAINLKSDAVQEYNIMSGTIPAQFGYTSGGVVNAVTRSGGNTVHGSVYEFLRNDAFDAEASFPRPSSGKQELRFNNYGGTLGGPIIRDKVFLFGNYEQYNFISKSPGYFSVPTVLERGGNFSDLGQVLSGTCTPINIYDDGTGTPTGSRPQFVFNGQANVINPARLDPVAVAYENYAYPLPNNTGGGYNSCTHANNYISSTPWIVDERQGIVRADYKVTNKDTIVAHYAYYLNKQNNGSGVITEAYGGRNDVLRNQSAMLSQTHVFKPTLLNDARFGMMRSDFPFAAFSANKNVAGIIGLPNSTPLVTPLMSNGLVTPNINIGFRSSTEVEILDDLLWVIKNHTVHLGGSSRWTEGFNYQVSGTSAAGNFNFSSATTAQGNDTTVTSGSGSTYASFLLGQVQSAAMNVAAGSAFRKMQYAGYIQDDWRLSPQLTLNLGIRYDMGTQAVEKHNGIENFDITQKNPTNNLFYGLVEYAATGGYGRNFVRENYGDFGPRLGFAYSLPRQIKTVIRGGAGIYYPTTVNNYYDSSAGNTVGYTSLITSWTNPTANGYLFQLSKGLPGSWGVPLGSKGGPNAFLGQSASYINPIAKDPSAQVFNLTVSQELPYGIVADASYIGNHGNHFVNVPLNLNFLSPQYYSLGTAALSAQVANPYAGLVPGTLGAATLTRAATLKPFPYMSSVTMQYPHYASYWSNMGMLSVQRRVQHGLQIIGAYTFAKVTDAGIAGVSDLAGELVGQVTKATPQNPYDPSADHSLDTIDVTHRADITALYDLPFGKGHRLATSHKMDPVVGGWQVNGILTMESGRPISVTGANNQLASRPNLNPNVSLKVKHQGRSVLYRTGQLMWFNPLAFVNPPDYTFGNAPRAFGNLFGPGTVNLDLSAFKTTHITERMSFEFRVEAFNALNHPNLHMPGTAFVAGAPADPSNPYAEGGVNTSATFGMITSGATTTRNVQLGGKLFF